MLKKAEDRSKGAPSDEAEAPDTERSPEQQRQQIPWYLDTKGRLEEGRYDVKAGPPESPSKPCSDDATQAPEESLHGRPPPL